MAAKYKSDLRFLEYSPDGNPLMEGTVIPIKRGQVRTGFNNRHLVDAETGELTAVSAIMKIEDKDDREFVKIFADGVKAAFDLSRTAHRVFQAILDVYQNTKMTNGYADSVHLVWFDGGLSGQQIGMSEYTYKRGLRELLDKGFLAPKIPNVFWVNPALFFKGDVVRFVKEYRRTPSVQEQEGEEIENQLSMAEPPAEQGKESKKTGQPESDIAEIYLKTCDFLNNQGEGRSGQ